MGSKILLVDDSELLLDAYLTFLRATTSHEVSGASSARSALDIARTWRPDVVVTDIVMADMNGLDLISHLLSELPPPVPMIVALSGFPDFAQEALRRGARLFQQKPIDPDDLLILIESLLGNREPPDHIRETAAARRKAASELAQAAVSAKLARWPYLAESARLVSRLLSRYFGDASVGLLTMREGHMAVFASSDSRWHVGAQPAGFLAYALDVVESGSTLVVPDVVAMAALSANAPDPDSRVLAAVPLRSPEGVTIGALVLADRRPIPFDAHDLGILEHTAAMGAQVLAGPTGPRLFQEPGVLRNESWRYFLRAELEHLRSGRNLVIALASLPARSGPIGPISTPEQLEAAERTTERLMELLPPRTALGRLTPMTVAAYGLVQDAEAGERALLSLFAALDSETRRACIAVVTVTGLSPTDGGAALLEILGWLLASATARGSATALRARLGPETIEARVV
jgi:DNA-binding NarL/FixJ family response regulator